MLICCDCAVIVLWGGDVGVVDVGVDVGVDV